MSEPREPEAFERLRAFVASGRTRTETTVTEIPSPSRIAPHSIALAAEPSSVAPGGATELRWAGRGIRGCKVEGIAAGASGIRTASSLRRARVQGQQAEVERLEAALAARARRHQDRHQK